MNSIFTVILYIIMLAISCVAFVAAWYGIVCLFNIDSKLGLFVATIISIILLDSPLLIGIAAIYGVVSYWNLSIWIGVLIFFIPYICSVIIGGWKKAFTSFGFFSRLMKKKTKNYDYDYEEQDNSSLVSEDEELLNKVYTYTLQNMSLKQIRDKCLNEGYPLSWIHAALEFIALHHYLIRCSNCKNLFSKNSNITELCPCCGKNTIENVSSNRLVFPCYKLKGKTFECIDVY